MWGVWGLMGWWFFVGVGVMLALMNVLEAFEMIV
jgi:hypothetical protein